MKKLLALVLALVMVMGLATVGTSAAVKFSDAADINYKEAVDVLSTIGVLSGDENGFRPKDALKRSEGAKILAYLMLQPAAAEQMTGGGKFTDVPATHWAAGYIEYLSVEGVINGVGDNKFDPDGTLTTAAFTKMLLGALGYDPVIEGMVGPDWMINTQRLAKKVGLFDGNPNAVISSNITREEAALYAFNMVCSPLVEYESKGNTLSVNGATIDFGASKANYRVNTGKKESRYTQIDTITTNQNTTDSQIIEFGEEYFEKLVLNTSKGKNNEKDDFGRPCNKWTYDGKKIGTYNVKEDLLYTTSVTLGQIYKDLALTSSTPVCERVTLDGRTFFDETESLWFVDGRERLNPQTLEVLRLSKESNTKIGGNGCETYVYYDEGEVRICCMNWYVGDVAGVYAATASKDAYIYVAGRNNENTDNLPVSGEKDVTGFNVDDVVRYNAHWDDTALTYKVDNVEKAEVVKGKLDAFVMYGNEGLMNSATGNITLAGKNYVYSAKVAGTPEGTLIKSNVELEVVLDKYGYVLDVSDYGVQNFAIVSGVSGQAGEFNDSKKVELIFTDGSKSGTVSLSSSYHTTETRSEVIGHRYDANGNEIEAIWGDVKHVYYKGTNHEVTKGDIVTYAIESNGNYSLEFKRHAWSDKFEGQDLILNGISTIQLGDMNLAGYPNANKTNGKTVFLIKDSEGNVKSYEGIKNVPSVYVDLLNDKDIWVNAYAKPNNAAAAVVWINLDGTKGRLRTEESIFVHFDKTHNKSVASGNDAYYELEAVVNGEKTTLKVDTKTYEEALRYFGVESFNKDYYLLYSSMTKNSKGIATLNDFEDNGYFTYSSGMKSGTIGLGSNKQADWVDAQIDWIGMTNDCKVFYINENNEIQPSSAGSIPDFTKTGVKAYVWYTMDKNGTDLKSIFWTKLNVSNGIDDEDDNREGYVYAEYIRDTILLEDPNEIDALVANYPAIQVGGQSALQKSLTSYEVTEITDVQGNKGYTLPHAVVDESLEIESIPANTYLYVDGNMNIPENYPDFTVDGNLYVDGKLSVGAGSKIIIKGKLVVNDLYIKGTAEQTAGSTKVVYGTEVYGNSWKQSGGNAVLGDTDVYGRFEVTNNAVATLDSLMIKNNGGTFKVNTATINVLGNTEIQSNSTVDIENGGTLDTDGDTNIAKTATLTFKGTGSLASSSLTGSGMIDVTASTITNPIDVDNDMISDDIKEAVKTNKKATVTVTLNVTATKTDNGFLWTDVNAASANAKATVKVTDINNKEYEATLIGWSWDEANDEVYVVAKDTAILEINITDEDAVVLEVDTVTVNGKAVDFDKNVGYLKGDDELVVTVDADEILEAKVEPKTEPTQPTQTTTE